MKSLLLSVHLGFEHVLNGTTNNDFLKLCCNCAPSGPHWVCIWHHSFAPEKCSRHPRIIGESRVFGAFRNPLLVKLCSFSLFSASFFLPILSSPRSFPDYASFWKTLLPKLTLAILPVLLELKTGPTPAVERSYGVDAVMVASAVVHDALVDICRKW